MRLCGLCLLVVVSLILCLGPADCQAMVSMAVAPPIVDLSVPAGGEQVIELKVYNGGDVPLEIIAYTSAIELGADGTPVPLGGTPGKWSCAEWIALDKEKFQLLHGEQEVVNATLRVPKGTSGGRYAVILFDASPILADPEEGNVAVGTRVGTIVLETVPLTLRQGGKIKAVEVSKQSDDEVDFKVYFLNTGNVHVKVRGSILIRDSRGEMIDRVPLEVGTGTVLPDGVRELRGKWSNTLRMKEGEYTGEVRVNCPGIGAVLDSVDFSI